MDPEDDGPERHRISRLERRGDHRAEKLDRLGVPSQRQTILVAGGLNRRAGHRELEALVAGAPGEWLLLLPGHTNVIVVKDSSGSREVQTPDFGQVLVEREPARHLRPRAVP